MRITFWGVSLFHLIGFVYSSTQGNTHPNISIIGGWEASAGQYPYMASLPFKLGSCGGTLIAPSYVLTAAHCVSIYQQSDLKGSPVYLNTLNVLGGETESIKVGVSSFVVHEGYSHVGTGYANDVALLVLDQPVDSITPVSLPKKIITASIKTTTKPKTTTKRTMKTTVKPSKKPIANQTTKKPSLRAFSTYANKVAYITGWGVHADGFNSDVLMKTVVTIFDNDVCTTKWGRKLFNGDSMMCAASVADGSSACMDDDGGPILVKGVQVGIASFFPEKCGDRKFPTVFTRVSAYINWIKNAMTANPPPTL